MRQTVRPLVSQPTNPDYVEIWVHRLSFLFFFFFFSDFLKMAEKSPANCILHVGFGRNRLYPIPLLFFFLFVCFLFTADTCASPRGN